MKGKPLTGKKNQVDPYLTWERCKYRFSSASAIKKTYLCIRYWITDVEGKCTWTYFKKANQVVPKGDLQRKTWHCPRVFIVPFNDRAKGTGYCSKMHACNLGLPVVHHGEPDWRPLFQLLAPSPHGGGLKTAQQVDELVNLITDTSNVTMWEPLTGKSGLRFFAPKLVECKEIYSGVEKAMKYYVDLVQQQYPALTLVQMGAIKSAPNAKSQYIGHRKLLHPDYLASVLERPPNEPPVSIIVALHPFNFLYLPDKT